jgi:hypothetical protein
VIVVGRPKDGRYEHLLRADLTSLTFPQVYLNRPTEE